MIHARYRYNEWIVCRWVSCLTTSVPVMRCALRLLIAVTWSSSAVQILWYPTHPSSEKGHLKFSYYAILWHAAVLCDLWQHWEARERERIRQDFAVQSSWQAARSFFYVCWNLFSISLLYRDIILSELFCSLLPPVLLMVWILSSD
jgi:hypothetical protein